MASDTGENDLVVGNITIPEDERTRCEVWTRVMGYYRPVSQWNVGKQAENADRKTFVEAKTHPGAPQQERLL